MVLEIEKFTILGKTSGTSYQAKLFSGQAITELNDSTKHDFDIRSRGLDDNRVALFVTWVVVRSHIDFGSQGNRLEVTRIRLRFKMNRCDTKNRCDLGCHGNLVKEKRC
jgi:hypothetical protein